MRARHRGERRQFLIPVDAKLARDYDVEDEAVAARSHRLGTPAGCARLRLIRSMPVRDNPSSRGLPALGLDARRPEGRARQAR